MRKILLPLLLLALAAYGQQTSVAVLPSEGTALGNDELEALTDKMRYAALKVLPTNSFTLLKQDVVVKRLGGAENYIKECSESSCIVDLGKKAQVDYVAQASVGRLGDKIRLKVELYNVRTEGLVGMLSDEESENVMNLLAIVEKRVPAEVFGKIPGSSGGKSSAPSFAGGIGGVEIKGTDYEFTGEKRHLASISSDPEGATLSFDGVPNSRCAKTPCKAELREGSVRIIASLEHYEIADTTVSIRQDQDIRIRMKANFGVLEIKPAYSDGIGSDERWSLSLNGKPISSWENRLLPGRYNVELSHSCYEAISFEAGINKDKREVFDMAEHIKLKKGGLDLSAEADGEPAGEPVFVNGKQVGKTPFSGSVPVCARIEIGEGREAVNVGIEHNASKRYTHQMSTEEMQRRREQQEQESKQRIQELEKQELERQARRVEEQRMALEKEAWHSLGAWSVGMPVMLNSIDSMYSSLGFQISGSVEFFKPKTSFFRFGLNFDIAFAGYDMDVLRRRISPDIDRNDISAASSFIKFGTFVRLYPADAFYLSGGANFGGYSGCKWEEPTTGEIIVEIPGTNTAVFPVGAGLVLGSDYGGFLLEALYNIVMLKNGRGYWSFTIGGKFGKKKKP